MIVGLGEDIVDINRIQKLIDEKKDRFLSKCFTAEEIQKGNSYNIAEKRIAYFAKRFAAKEACLKALGTGMREGLSWQDMTVLNDDLGRPFLDVSGGVFQKLEKLIEPHATARIHLTLADEGHIAKATVIIESI